MKITKLTEQKKNVGRVNVFVDGRYRLSLSLAQVVEMGVKVGVEVEDLGELERASEFGKVYQRALEYCLARPRSVGEVRDYLRRRRSSIRPANSEFFSASRTRRMSNTSRLRFSKENPDFIQTNGAETESRGFSEEVAEMVLGKLAEGKYVDDERFAKWWVENRMVRKGVSERRLRMELMKKGVDGKLIDAALAESVRDERAEMRKIIEKKQKKYTDEKLVEYLVRQGFGWQDAKEAVAEEYN